MSDLSYEELESLYADRAIHDVASVTSALRKLAESLDLQATNFRHPHRAHSDTQSTARSIVNDLIQGTGNIGAHVWGVLKSAQELQSFREDHKLEGQAQEIRNEERAKARASAQRLADAFEQYKGETFSGQQVASDVRMEFDLDS